MDEMDELLAQVKAEYQTGKANPKKSASSPAKIASSNPNSSSTAPLDNLLADLKEEYDSVKSGTDKLNNKSENSYQDIISCIKPELADQNQALIDDLKREHQKQVKVEQEKQQQAVVEAQQRQEQQELRRQAALKQKAQQWLDNLNLNSDEGLWFEEFAYAYDSKLAAAIDYLQAMKESEL